MVFLHLMFICLSKQEDCHACGIDMGKVMVSKGRKGSLCMESPIQEGKSIQTNVSEWLVCITNMNSPFTHKFSLLREVTMVIFRRLLFSV